MKIFLTRFNWDGQDHEGPLIRAENWTQAETIAEYYGLIVEGELTDIIGTGDEITSRVLH